MTTMSMRRITAFLLVMIMMITSLPLSLAEETVNGLLPAEQTAEIRLSEEPEAEEAPEEIPEASYSVLEGEEALIAMERDAAQAAARQFQEGFFGAALKQREHHLVTSHDALGAICPHQAKRAGHIFIAGMLSHHIYSPIIRLFSRNRVFRNRCAYQQSSAGTALSKRYVCAASGYFSRSTSLMNISSGRT